MVKNSEMERNWLATLHRLEISRHQGSSLVLTRDEVLILLEGVESYEEELAQVRTDPGPLVPMKVRTHDDGPVATL